MKMKTSSLGREFLENHEGNPKTAYLDSGGVPTVGIGFTMRSPAVKAALARLGITKIVPGKTKLTAAQSDMIFSEVLAKEFEPIVDNGSPKNRVVKQNMFDAMVSATYNLGPKFMTWRWIAPWRDSGNVGSSAAIWASNYNTANGKKLDGLVRRRIEEANMFLKGIYAGTKGEGVLRDETSDTKPDPIVKEAQEILTKLGIPVEADGWMGPKTKKAILAYQKLHPDLEPDGKLGKATLTQLRKDAEAIGQIVKDVAGKGLSTAVTVGSGAWYVGLPWAWIGTGIVVLAILYFSWRYRDVLKRKFNSFMGK